MSSRTRKRARLTVGRPLRPIRRTRSARRLAGTTPTVPRALSSTTRAETTSKRLDANNIPGSRPGGGPNNNYLFDFDADLGPGDNLLQAVTNLFYWNNVTHDLMYLYGFDEASGNFQVNNYGNPGNGGDPVQADAQDGSGTNNANFATPPDGADPRMQMFIWTAPATLTVNSPPNIAGDYIVGTADFGEPLDQTGLTGDLEVVDDGTGLPTEGCNALVGFTAGNVAVIDRGSCEFGQKVLNAEQAGASGAIVVNNQGDGILNGAGRPRRPGDHPVGVHGPVGRRAHQGRARRWR